MTDLNFIMDSVKKSVENGDTPVYADYDSIPVKKHEPLYVTIGFGEIELQKDYNIPQKRGFIEKYILNIRVVAEPNTPPRKLYNILDKQVLDGLVNAGFFVRRIVVSAPKQDGSLGKFVLPCSAEVSGRLEVSHESSL